MTRHERRQAIVTAVLPLVVETGTLPTTRQIAEAAGVAEGTIFRVFDDKNSLLLAVAEHAVSPDDGEDRLREALAAVTDLRERVRLVVVSLQVTMERVSVVLMAVRSALEHDPGRALSPAGPPEFLVRANERLEERLTALFEPYADDLQVPPRTAGLVLRSIIFGSHHPGMRGSAGPEAVLTSDQITDVVLNGVCHHEGGHRC
jgi:AcrR family transcriptional regulator